MLASSYAQTVGCEHRVSTVLHAEDRGGNRHSPALPEPKAGEKDVKAGRQHSETQWVTVLTLPWENYHQPSAAKQQQKLLLYSSVGWKCTVDLISLTSRY